MPFVFCDREDSQGRIYYYNSVTKETKWEHPLDSYYKAVVKKERLRTGLQASAVDGNYEDSGASLMSSLDDIPPLSTFGRVSDPERTVIHPEQTVVPTSSLNTDKRRLFISKSCPTNLHVLAAKEDRPLQQVDSDSESHTATLQNKEEKLPGMKELLCQKQALLSELEQLKQEVQKYRRLREQLRASTKRVLVNLGACSKASSNTPAQAAAKLHKSLPSQGIVSMKTGSRSTGDPAKSAPTVPAFGSGVGSSLGHAELRRLGQRLANLRLRHLQISTNAAAQIAEDALASPIAPPALCQDATSRTLVPSVKLLAATSELVSQRPGRALVEKGHPRIEPPSSVLPQGWQSRGANQEDDRFPQWSRAEWTAKLSQLRWNLGECELHQLLIK